MHVPGTPVVAKELFIEVDNSVETTTMDRISFALGHIGSYRH